MGSVTCIPPLPQGRACSTYPVKWRWVVDGWVGSSRAGFILCNPLYFLNRGAPTFVCHWALQITKLILGCSPPRRPAAPYRESLPSIQESQKANPGMTPHLWTSGTLGKDTAFGTKQKMGIFCPKPAASHSKLPGICLKRKKCNLRAGEKGPSLLSS